VQKVAPEDDRIDRRVDAVDPFVIIDSRERSEYTICYVTYIYIYAYL
jgi:hypothetical protein